MSGEQWATYADAARNVRVREDLIRKWKKRGVIDSTIIGGKVHVDLADVRRAERDLRLHGSRPGRRRAVPSECRQSEPEVAH